MGKRSNSSYGYHKQIANNEGAIGIRLYYE